MVEFRCKQACIDASKTFDQCQDCIRAGTAPFFNHFPTVKRSTSAPTVNDDEDLGYKSGDIWIDTDDAIVYICLSAANGAADWDRIN